MKKYEIDEINENDEDFFCEDNNDIVFEDLLHSLNITKSLIDKNPKKWNNCKKCINEYEYVYSSSFSNKNICKKKPVSRSYFKILEIIKSLEIKNYKKVDSIAEAPGGFLEFFNENTCDICAISLISGDNSIPHWNHNIIRGDNIKIISGKDNTGDIYKLENILYYVKCSGQNKSDIVTGDGGFDYTQNFSNQELDSYPLIFSEVLMALLLLKNEGIFICKIFDILHLKTIKILYILRKLFDKMYIVKPSMSRTTNSEKYVVCIGYKGYDKESVNMMIHNFQKDLQIKVPKLFIENLRIFNIHYVSKQIEEIKKGVSMMEDNMKKYPSTIQIEIGKNWCTKYGLDINETFFNSRRFNKR